MKICIYGAGAIGGYLGAELADSGCEVTLIARGPHLQAMQDNGLTLQLGDETKIVDIAATDDPATVGPQDYVIIALKAHSVIPVVDQMVPLLGPDTAVVTAQNGILWWYFYGLSGRWENHQLESADPGGRIWAALGPERAIGCVVSCSLDGLHGAFGHRTDHSVVELFNAGGVYANNIWKDPPSQIGPSSCSVILRGRHKSLDCQLCCFAS